MSPFVRFMVTTERLVRRSFEQKEGRIILVLETTRILWSRLE
jgi:hypothetical protein